MMLSAERKEGGSGGESGTNCGAEIRHCLASKSENKEQFAFFHDLVFNDDTSFACRIHQQKLVQSSFVPYARAKKKKIYFFPHQRIHWHLFSFFLSFFLPSFLFSFFLLQQSQFLHSGALIKCSHGMEGKRDVQVSMSGSWKEAGGLN